MYGSEQEQEVGAGAREAGVSAFREAEKRYQLHRDLQSRSRSRRDPCLTVWEMAARRRPQPAHEALRPPRRPPANCRRGRAHYVERPTDFSPVVDVDAPPPAGGACVPAKTASGLRAFAFAAHPGQ